MPELELPAPGDVRWALGLLAVILLLTAGCGPDAASTAPATTTGALVDIGAEWATGSVKRVALTSDGAISTGTTSTFLTGLSNPVPLITTADGSLLVGDWTTGTVCEVATHAAT